MGNIKKKFVAAAALIAFALAASSAVGEEKNDTSKIEKIDLKELLTHNSVFWSRLGWAYNPPRADSDGKAIMMIKDDAPEARFHRDFKDAGIKIHSTILFSGWIGADKLDFSETDATLEKLFNSTGNDIYYIPRIKLDVPPDWCAKNPQDTTVYYPAKFSDKEISELANTLAHDWTGMEWSRGYNAYGNPRDRVDDRPNVHGLIGLQSFSSKKWLHDAGEVLRKLIRHIETEKYGKNVIAYHIAFGQTGETTFWRSWEKNDYRFGDYGKNNLRAFYDWGLKKYGSQKHLAKVWNQPEISRENIALPTPMERELHWKNHSEFFRATPQDQISIDYDKFHNGATVHAIEYFAKIVKEESGKGAGAFYGYYLNVPRSAYAGHLEFDALLNSPYIDFLAAPKGYRNFLAGDTGMVQCPPMSINLKKIFISEIDPPSPLFKWGKVKTFADFRTILWREFSSCMQSRSGFWWMDLGGGWYDSPEIVGEIKKIEDAAKIIRSQPAKSVADVLVVSDTESLYFQKPSWMLSRDILLDSVSRIRSAGALIDHYRLADLTSIDLSKYKTILFMNCTRISERFWSDISQRMRKDCTIVWHHAPALRNESGYAISNAEKITGFKLALHKPSAPEIVKFSAEKKSDICKDFNNSEGGIDPEKPYPLFCAAQSPEVEILAKFKDGTTAYAKTKIGQRINYFISLPAFPIDIYREIFEDAGVCLVAPKFCAVYGDNRILGFFPSKDVSFKLSLKGKYKDLLSGKIYSQNDLVKIAAKRAMVLSPVK